jgi:hypothetical protein
LVKPRPERGVRKMPVEFAPHREQWHQPNPHSPD